MQVFQTARLHCNDVMPCVLWRLVRVYSDPVTEKNIWHSNCAIFDKIWAVIPLCVNRFFALFFSEEICMFVYTMGVARGGTVSLRAPSWKISEMQQASISRMGTKYAGSTNLSCSTGKKNWLALSIEKRRPLDHKSWLFQWCILYIFYCCQ